MDDSYLVLLVEDNVDDMHLTREGFRRCGASVEVHSVSDGQTCLRYLRKEAEFSTAKSPDLVMVDLNMPMMDGRDVLSEIRRDPTLKHLVVVILTTSRDPADVLTCYSLGCQAYVVKPLDFYDFQVVIGQLCTFWFKTASLPKSRHPY